MFKIKKIALVISISLGMMSKVSYATEFNLDVMDVADRENVDVSQFSKAGYVMSGTYVLTVYRNNDRLGQPQDIVVYPNEDNNNPFQQFCIPAQMFDAFGLKTTAKEKVTLVHDNKCLDFSRLDGVTASIDLSTLKLRTSVPQSYLEYNDPNWTPPSLWDEGVNGGFIDYNANVSVNKPHNSHDQIFASTSGIAGININSWRIRANYSGQYQRQKNSNRSNTSNSFDVNRVYAFTSLKNSASLLTVGENSFYSNLFDAWLFTGVSLESDENMLPPKLTGYAPEIIGTAKTNATIIVRNQDRIILETTVPPGPFKIDTLESGIRGVLDVTIREDNGEERHFSLNTASLPYLTRPGRLSYKFAAGRTRYDNHDLTGSFVLNGEFSYGVSNAWSLYGGTQLSPYYQSVALGIGRDLFDFGTISFDVNQSFAEFDNEYLLGRSYRVNYTKSFDNVRTSINFAGYRFADRDYKTLTQFMDEKRIGMSSLSPKSTYQIYVNKYFDKFNLSLNYQHSTYWQNNSQTQYGLYTGTQFNLPWLSRQDAYLSLSANRTTRDNGRKDDVLYLSLTIPLFSKHSISFSESLSRSLGQNSYNHQMSYNGNGDNNNYGLSVGYNQNKHMDNQSSFSGFYSHDLSQANLSANASYVPDGYRSLGASINSGITMTSHGIALHRSAYGDTRLMIETPDTSGVPLSNGKTKTNAMGVAVLTNINSYRKSTVLVNTSLLPDNIESLEPSTDVTLTKGAIGYRIINVIKGEKLFAVLMQKNGNPVPFGSSIRNEQNRELGIVGDDGVAWIVGVSAKETLSLYWAGKKQCDTRLPDNLTSTDMLLLACMTESNNEISIK